VKSRGKAKSITTSTAAPPATAPGFATTPGIAPPRTGFVPPRALLQITPNIRNIPAGSIPRKMRVTVDVNVDQTGRVTSARLATPGVNSAVSSAAVAAARQWTFDPAMNNGQYIKSAHKIVFEFPVR
jgi:TonB family protein